MIVETVIKRTFEVGDLFIFTGKPLSGSAYTKGDFLLIKAFKHLGHIYHTKRLITGECQSARGSDDYLNREMDAGVLSYMGKVVK